VLLGHVKELDPPSRYTKTVVGAASLLSFGAIVYQYSGYFPSSPVAFDEMKYLDSLLLLLLVGFLCIVGAVFTDKATRLGLISACVGGFGMLSSTYLGWTPDAIISLVVGLSLLFMGGLAYAAWSLASKPKKKIQAQVN
jgi:hypothetical protein